MFVHGVGCIKVKYYAFDEPVSAVRLANMLLEDGIPPIIPTDRRGTVLPSVGEVSVAKVVADDGAPGQFEFADVAVFGFAFFEENVRLPRKIKASRAIGRALKVAGVPKHLRLKAIDQFFASGRRGQAKQETCGDIHG